MVVSPSDVGVRAGRFLVDGSCLFSEEVGSISVVSVHIELILRQSIKSVKYFVSLL